MPTLLQQLEQETIINLDEFHSSLKHNDANTVSIYKAALDKIKTTLDARFRTGEDIRKLIHGRAWEIDRIIQTAWSAYKWPKHKIALIAVGGYGRGELHPYSDIDLLILHNDDIKAETYKEIISKFITLLWDIGLDVGSSVRSLSECYKKARKDITIATNLIESRTIIGDKSLHAQMYNKVTSENAWTDKEFFIAKLQEQKERHQKTNNTEYSLEPNLKISPGGLRDLQTIGWVSKRHFGSTYISDLVSIGFLTEPELNILSRGELYLWTVRYALHMLCNKREDRLLFDHQRTLADFFGYEDQEGRLAVEQFMAKYYRIAMTLSVFNDMLLQYFDEAILRANEPQSILPLNSRFQIHNDFIEATHPNIFTQSPSALMELFVLLAKNNHIKGVRASTMRLIRENRYLINNSFRKNKVNNHLFISLLKEPERVSTELRRMTRYGILGRYLPEFGEIIGQMQHDLFHIYTVDAHTIAVIRKCRQFRHNEWRDEFPIPHRIVNQLPKIELLYIAALFHDIGKGRGGDHSELGAVDAKEFCQQHSLGKWDTQLIVWLVKNHLVMSMTAQRKDISDPEVIHNFAQQMQDVIHLDYLCVLTIADICATNHSLWNSWRATLMRKLYTDTKRALRRGLENPVDKEVLIEQVQNETLIILQRKGIEQATVKELWAAIGDDYFLRETAQSIAEHTQAILEHENLDEPLILIRQTSYRVYEGATEIFIYSKNIKNLFAATVAAMDQLHLNIQDARIIATNNERMLNTYTVLSDDNTPISENPTHLQHIKKYLIEELDNPEDYPEIIQRKVPRQMKLFSSPTQVELSTDTLTEQTVIEVTSPDRPGLLARLGRIFSSYNLIVNKAKIASIGERVEDFFFITDSDNKPLSDPELCRHLKHEICNQLDEHV